MTEHLMEFYSGLKERKNYSYIFTAEAGSLQFTSRDSDKCCIHTAEH